MSGCIADYANVHYININTISIRLLKYDVSCLFNDKSLMKFFTSISSRNDSNITFVSVSANLCYYRTFACAVKKKIKKINYSSVKIVCALPLSVNVCQHRNIIITQVINLRLKIYKLYINSNLIRFFVTRFTSASRVRANIRHTLLKSYLQYVH